MEKSLILKISELFIRFRKQSNLNKDSVSDVIDVSKSRYYRYEKGDFNINVLATLLALGKKAGYTHNDVFNLLSQDGNNGHSSYALSENIKRVIESKELSKVETEEFILFAFNHYETLSSLQKDREALEGVKNLFLLPKDAKCKVILDLFMAQGISEERKEELRSSARKVIATIKSSIL